jgi:hypothetical protein
MTAKIVEPMKRKRTVQVFDVEEWPICEYCGMPIEPNELDWHRHQERWLLKQQQTEDTRKESTEKNSEDFVPQVYISAEVLEPPKK